MHDYVDILRQLWKGEHVVYDGLAQDTERQASKGAM